MNLDKPIGILDSGVGGLSVFAELIKTLPNESTIYFADSKNCPYGEKNIDEVETLTDLIIRFLLHKKHCKLILIACNTVTSTLINKFRLKYNIPFVGIEPATKVAVKNTATFKIGILATEGTRKSELFNQTKSRYAGNIDVKFQVGKGLVQLVEKGDLFSQKTIKTLQKYIEPLNKYRIDQLVLGCTHYSFLSKAIKTLLNSDLSIIDPAPAVARQVKDVLKKKKLLNNDKQPPTRHFFSSGDIFLIKELLPGIDQSKFEIIKNFIIDVNDQELSGA